MRIEKLIIENFISIKQAEIDLSSDFITIIGKNGSGKSNILDAIYTFFDKDSYGKEYINRRLSCLIKLKESDVLTWCKDIEIDDELKTVEVTYEYGKERVKRLKSKALVESIKQSETNMIALKEEASTLGESLVEKIKDVFGEKDEIGRLPDGLIELVNVQKTEELPIHSIKWTIASIERALGDLKEIEKEVFFEDGTFNLAETYSRNISLNINKELKIRKRKVELSNIESRFLNFDYEGFDKALSEINLELKRISVDFYRKIVAFEKEFNKHLRNIDKINDQIYEQNENIEKRQDEFVSSIKNLIHRDIYFIDNENSIVFGNHESYNYSTDRKYRKDRNPFRTVIVKKILPDKSDDNGKIDWSKMSDQDRQQSINKINQFLEKKMPKFEEGMIKSISVELDEKNELQLLIVEKNGQKVRFDYTSLGRRWYYTYFFTKELLKPGDILLLDEPASFLHPVAQKELVVDLEKLAKTGVKVIICTHSPYMISENLDVVVSVKMTESGTKSEIVNVTDLSNIMAEVGQVDINDFLLNIGNRLVLVEGQGDIECLKQFQNILNIKQNITYLKLCGADKGKQVCDFFKSNNMRYICLIDADKKRVYENSVFNVLIVGDKTPDMAIEGLFIGDDRKRYLNMKGDKLKLNPKKIRLISQNSIETGTLQNFNKLFKAIGVKFSND